VCVHGFVWEIESDDEFTFLCYQCISFMIVEIKSSRQIVL